MLTFLSSLKVKIVELFVISKVKVVDLFVISKVKVVISLSFVPNVFRFCVNV